MSSASKPTTRSSKRKSPRRSSASKSTGTPFGQRLREWWPPWRRDHKGAGNRKRKGSAPREPRTKGQIALAILKWCAISGLAMVAAGLTLLAILFWMYGRDPNLPSVNQLQNYEPKQVIKIVTADDAVIGELFSERRTVIKYKDIPKHVIRAFVSAEDANFFEHEGIDYAGMLRALIVNIRSGKKKQGASTITQQVVKTFLLSPERTFKRKFQEIILARRLEKKLTKQQILSLYLNQIYFGHGRYGIVEAARFYFGKEVKELYLGEAALLASLPQSPEHLSPRRGKKARIRVCRRQCYVLQQMAANRYIDQKTADLWCKKKVKVLRHPYPHMNEAPEWVDQIRHNLDERFGEGNLDKLGLKVETTVDLAIQADAEAALRAGLRAVDKRRGFGRPIRTVVKDKIKLAIARLAHKLPDGGPAPHKVYEAVVVEVHDKPGELVVDLGNWRASIILNDDRDHRYNPRGETPSQRFKVGSVVKVMKSGADAMGRRPPDHTDRTVDLAPGPQGAIVVIDVKTRKVLAMVGGYNTRVGDFNRATMAKRQPGSSFKPFVYAAAINSDGDYHASTVVNDAPEVYNLWKPKNYSHRFSGPVRLRYALAKSINTVAIRLAHEIGPERVAELAHAMGIQSKLPTTLSLALGSGEVTPLEMTNAFATFAAGGRAAPPRFITSIAGELEPAGEWKQVITAQTAYIITNMMQSVTTYGGTAWRLAKLRMEVGGKTGTTNDRRDAWFVSVTPNLAVGVWVGFDDNRSLGGHEGGGKTAAPVFAEFVQRMRKRGAGNRFGKHFVRPSGIETARVDKVSGKLAPKGAPRKTSYVEVFAKGGAPTDVAVAPDKDRADEVFSSEYDDDKPADGKDTPKPTDKSKSAVDKSTPRKRAVGRP